MKKCSAEGEVVVAFLQTCLPDYRVPLFTRLAERFHAMRLYCGSDYFTRGVRVSKGFFAWQEPVANRFLFVRSLLWQPLRVGIRRAPVLVAEFNPRILSIWVLLALRRLTGRRTILWGHLWGQQGPRWLRRMLRVTMLRLSDGVVCYTASQANELRKLMPTLPAWVAPNSCVARESCVVVPSITHRTCIAYVGRMISAKKPSVLVEAFALAMPSLPENSRLLLVGDGDALDSLKARIKQLGLENRVEVFGHVSDPRALAEIYARSAVAVSPGYVGLSAVQAMGHGVPMLVPHAEPHSPEIEACVEGQTCEFFRANDAADLSAKITGFLAPDSPWPARREHISAFIARNYTYEGMVDGFVEAVNATLAPSAGGVAFVWQQFGPYHLARLRELRMVLGQKRVFGAEVASQTATYAWARGELEGDDLVTLLPGRVVEAASATEIYRAAIRVFRDRNVSVVFVPSYWPASSLAVLLAAKSVGARVVMMNDSHARTAGARGILAAVKRRLVRQFDAALVAGSPQRDYFSAMGLPAEKIVLGYDAVDNVYFAERAARARADSPAVGAKHGLPPRYFLNVGRMVWKKNLETLVDGYAEVKRRLGAGCPRLVLVGSGKLERSLQDRCAVKALSVWRAGADDGRPGDADVFFYGFRQIDQLPEFYALAECFVLPSREEEWGLVVNEAMACGLPVIVSKVAGCAPDLVKHGENGYQFDPMNAEELAGYLEKIVRDPEGARRMGEASQRIIAGWGCERFAKAAKEAAEIALR